MLNRFPSLNSSAQHGLKFAKGTTTLAFKYQGGVIVSVDSRSTQGSYIGARPGRARSAGATRGARATTTR